VVCYQANSISYAIAKRLVKIKYISLVNLILNRESVRELIQGDLTYENMKHELSLLLHDDVRIAKMKADYDELHGLLGGPGASEKVATAVLKSL
jgi:lipid-A-disaccharide synthase